MLKRLNKYWGHVQLMAEIKMHEKKYERGLKYMFYGCSSKTLLVVFSAFGSTDRRTYNYVRTLHGCRVDRLYILDPWGYKGSYNLYDGGDNYPWYVTNALIRKIVKRGEYKKIITAGSSKGGTCALLFGLQQRADLILTGACQYNIGTYVGRFPSILHGMMGEKAGEKDIQMLDTLVANSLDKAAKSKYLPEIHVLFSRKELTFERQIKDLLSKLEEHHFPTVLTEETFEEHSDVGQYFGPYLKKLFVK